MSNIEMKICYRCKKLKPIEDFHKDCTKKDGRQNSCKACAKKRRKKPSEKSKITAQKYKLKYRKTKRGKELLRKSNERYIKNNPLKVKISYRKNHLNRSYGLTPLQYNEMLKKQNGRCAICDGINANGRRLSVDHCHETGKNRGLLCDKCNFVLGWAGDSIEVLANAIKYLCKVEDS